MCLNNQVMATRLCAFDQPVFNGGTAVRETFVVHRRTMMVLMMKMMGQMDLQYVPAGHSNKDCT